jgi:hypothetical protein
MVCEAIEGHENPLRAQQFVQGLFTTQPDETTEDQVTRYAMGKILGEPLPYPLLPDEDSTDPERSLFLSTSWAWMVWASGSPTNAALVELKRQDLQEEGPSVLHHLALSNWALAVRSLLKGDMTEAKRRYRRALDVGSQFGTETNAVIVWTYAASFFCPGE